MIITSEPWLKKTMLRFILSIDALRRSRATSILLSYDSVLEVKVNCNEECALRSEAGKRIEMSPKSRGSSLMLLGNVTDLLNSTVSLPGILAGVLYGVEALLEKVITLIKQLLQIALAILRMWKFSLPPCLAICLPLNFLFLPDHCGDECAKIRACVPSIVGEVSKVNQASTLQLVAEDTVSERHHLRRILSCCIDCISYRFNDFAKYYQYG